MRCRCTGRHVGFGAGCEQHERHSHDFIIGKPHAMPTPTILAKQLPVVTRQCHDDPDATATTAAEAAAAMTEPKHM